TCELDPLVGETERSRECMRERGLAHAGDVLYQQVSAGQQAGERQTELAVLAEDDPVEIGKRRLDQLDGARVPGRGHLVQRRAQGLALMRWTGLLARSAAGVAGRAAPRGARTRRAVRARRPRLPPVRSRR